MSHAIDQSHITAVHNTTAPNEMLPSQHTCVYTTMLAQGQNCLTILFSNVGKEPRKPSNLNLTTGAHKKVEGGEPTPQCSPLTSTYALCHVHTYINAHRLIINQKLFQTRSYYVVPTDLELNNVGQSDLKFSEICFPKGLKV